MKYCSQHWEFKLRLILVSLPFFLFNLNTFGQDYFNSNSHQGSKITSSFFHSVYNYDFVNAKESIEGDIFKQDYKLENDILHANLYWWLIISGENTPENFNDCNKYLDNAGEYIKSIKRTRDLTESEIFSEIYINAYKARLEIFNEHNLLALKYLYNTIASIEIALEREAININYKLVAGLYNYFVAYTIDKYPIFYPYFFLFPKGNKQKGLNQLETCKNSKDIFIYTEANYFLMKINLEFENNYELANNYSNRLAKKYDSNLLFQYYNFKSYLLLNQNSKAISEFRKLKKIAHSNNQLSFVQKEHLLKIALIDLENNGISIEKLSYLIK